MASLYSQTVPVFIKYLGNLSGLLTKGQAHADKNGTSHEEMISFRLIEDMRGLAYQVQSCSNVAKFLAVRIGGMEDVVLEDNETTFEQLQARITRTIDILKSLDPKCMEGKEDTEIIMETGSKAKYRFENGQEYVSVYTIPFFHFHLSTAYCLLRRQGVDIGALDYLKDVFHKVE